VQYGDNRMLGCSVRSSLCVSWSHSDMDATFEFTTS
jgi:hypothetical protein